MRYTILGTTQALRDDGTPVALGGARLRALLAALALRPGRVRPPDVLIGEVWDGDPPADATGALQALVGRLRRALGARRGRLGRGRLPAGRRAATTSTCYRFERLAAEGARALADGDPAKAAGLLDDALALWRGPALADLPDRGAAAARSEALRLDARRAAARRRTRARPRRRRSCPSSPRCAPTTRWTSRCTPCASARCAPPAAPPTPWPPTRRSRRRSPTGSAPTRARNCGPCTRELLAATAGRGPAPLRRPAPRPRPPAPPPPARRGNLRARLTSFVGREAELRGDRAATWPRPAGDAARARRRRQDPAVAGGRRAGRRGRWPDGVWLAELAPVDDPPTLPEAVLSALGLRETVAPRRRRRGCAPPPTDRARPAAPGSPTTAPAAGCCSCWTTAST